MSALADLTPAFEEAFDALERGDIDRFTAIVEETAHADCGFRSGIGSVVGGGEYRGVEGIRGWFEDLIESTAERRWRNRRYETHGERAIVFLADFEFTGAASGIAIEAETGVVFRFEAGRCTRIDSFMSHETARDFAEASLA